MYLCNHINRTKSLNSGIQLNKEGISEEMVQHSHDMFMDTWLSGQICNLKSTCLFYDLLERVDALVLYINIQLK